MMMMRKMIIIIMILMMLRMTITTIIVIKPIHVSCVPLRVGVFIFSSFIVEYLDVEPLPDGAHVQNPRQRFPYVARIGREGPVDEERRPS